MLKGGCAFLQVTDRHIFYLVTKQKYFQKPTMKALQSSLEAMRKLCEENQIRRLAMPRIGCGLDRLSWEKVAPMIKKTFNGLNIEIEIYSLE